jgi:hypothetical protein
MQCPQAVIVFVQSCGTLRCISRRLLVAAASAPSFPLTGTEASTPRGWSPVTVETQAVCGLGLGGSSGELQVGGGLGSLFTSYLLAGLRKARPGPGPARGLGPGEPEEPGVFRFQLDLAGLTRAVLLASRGQQHPWSFCFSRAPSGLWSEVAADGLGVVRIDGHPSLGRHSLAACHLSIGYPPLAILAAHWQYAV